MIRWRPTLVVTILYRLAMEYALFSPRTVLQHIKTLIKLSFVDVVSVRC